ncbi:MAG TPA: hypothetical protein VF755_28135 [Catenuloplanes sp.]|jgi:hypothetical protein
MPTAAVARHAGSVDHAAEAMDTGRQAAAQVQMGAEAYGQLCAFLPGLIGAVADRAVTALGESASALRETALSLRSAVAAAEDTDADAARRIVDVGGRIELPL